MTANVTITIPTQVHRSGNNKQPNGPFTVAELVSSDSGVTYSQVASYVLQPGQSNTETVTLNSSEFSLAPGNGSSFLVDLSSDKSIQVAEFATDGSLISTYEYGTSFALQFKQNVAKMVVSESA